MNFERNQMEVLSFINYKKLFKKDDNSSDMNDVEEPSVKIMKGDHPCSQTTYACYLNFIFIYYASDTLNSDVMLFS